MPIGMGAEPRTSMDNIERWCDATTDALTRFHVVFNVLRTRIKKRKKENA